MLSSQIRPADWSNLSLRRHCCLFPLGDSVLSEDLLAMYSISADAMLTIATRQYDMYSCYPILRVWYRRPIVYHFPMPAGISLLICHGIVFLWFLLFQGHVFQMFSFCAHCFCVFFGNPCQNFMNISKVRFQSFLLLNYLFFFLLFAGPKFVS